MLVIGLIKEGKVPADNRVALTPSQCRWLSQHFVDIEIIVQSCPHRCFSDEDYRRAGVEVKDTVDECNLLMGIKEVPVDKLINGKTYLFFSHTKKKQPYNQLLFHAMMDKNITLIDYESMEHEDGQRVIGFGFFAGIVGAHNGMMAYGKRTGLYELGRVFLVHDYRQLIHTYFGVKLPNLKVAITGSGRVAHGILEIMNLLDIQEVESDEYKNKKFDYPVYVHLKGSDLYRHVANATYSRDDFHLNAPAYQCLFDEYIPHTDILMNGIYWDRTGPRLFEWDNMKLSNFAIKTIADITDDMGGSVPCNLGDATKEEPVYGVDKLSGIKTDPYLFNSVDIMALGNLPNELPRDASRYFGEQLIKYVLDDIRKGGSPLIERATMLKDGKLTKGFDYLKEYAAH
jgi:saccharopine dehydrogenase (NAD+, L-lysine-forming)